MTVGRAVAPLVDVDGLTELRIHDPDAILRAASARRHRPLVRADGRLMVIAADHPARGSLAARGERAAMADRAELLRRLVTALARPGVDGVLGTADVLEDLLLLGALDDKLVVGSMNRGGLQGSRFEIDDRFTGYDVQTLADMGFDGGKMLCRIDFDDTATVSTLHACADAVTGLGRQGLLAMIEPFIASRVDGHVRNDLSTDAVIRSVAIASGLGATSRRTWLKLPVTQRMEQVVAATTLPVLLLGGDPAGSDDDIYDSWRRALELPGVRGLVVGRSLLFPPGDDVAAAVDTAVALVHDDGTG